jgi:MobC-like protein
MEQKQSSRRTWLTIRMSAEEHQEAERLSSETTCQSLSEYARKAVLGKPVVMRYRNQSLDDFMESMVALQNELNAIGTNFNQQIRRLHTLRHAADIEQWILVNEQDKTRLFQQIETISNIINKAYQLWLRA